MKHFKTRRQIQQEIAAACNSGAIFGAYYRYGWTLSRRVEEVEDNLGLDIYLVKQALKAVS